MLRLEIFESITIGNIVLVATGDNLAVLDQDGLVAVLLDGIHGMGDKNNGLRWIFLDFGEEVVALTLECFVADG